jgi:hypothetical protein
MTPLLRLAAVLVLGKVGGLVVGVNKRGVGYLLRLLLLEQQLFQQRDLSKPGKVGELVVGVSKHGEDYLLRV